MVSWLRADTLSVLRANASRDASSSNLLRTKNVIQSLSYKYSDPSYYGVVTMLGLLNEPATYLSSSLLATTKQYWYDAYAVARYPYPYPDSSAKSGLALIIHDGFQPLSSYDNYMSGPNYEDVFIDTHNYQVFSDEVVGWDWPTHVSVGLRAHGSLTRRKLIRPRISAVRGQRMPIRPSG